MLRTGPFGDGFGVDPDGTSLDDLLGTAARPRLRCRWSSGSPTSCAPRAARSSSPRSVFVGRPRPARRPRSRRSRIAAWCSSGRRHLRSNNSWMHNINVLVKGAPRCTLQVHPDDAVSLGLADGAAGVDHVAGRLGERAGRGDRLDPPGRRQPARTVGPRHARHADACRRRTRRRELQRAVRRHGDRSAVGHVRPQRHPGRPSPPRPPEPVIPRLRQEFETGRGFLSQTSISACWSMLRSSTCCSCSTGNSQGCTPFAPQGALRRVALCRLRHGTRTRRRAPKFVRHSVDGVCLGSEPCTCGPCRSRPCSPSAARLTTPL